MVTGLLIVAALGVGLGLVAGRWWALLPVAAVWPIYVVGRAAGWWGAGLSQDTEGWLIATLTAIVTLVAVSAAALGIAARRAIIPRIRH